MDAKLYIKKYKNKKIVFKEWIDIFLSCFNNDKVILDIGSGLGYNADYIESVGYKVIRSDIDENFIKFQKKPVRYLNILKLDNEKKYSAIFMALVVSMFSPQQVNKIFSNCSKMLRNKGFITFNVPIEWGENDIKDILYYHSFEIVKMMSNKTWWFVIAKKKS